MDAADVPAGLSACSAHANSLPHLEQKDNAELKGQVRSLEKLRAEAEQTLAAALKAHGEEANRLRRISKKTGEELEDAQLQLKAAQERLSTLELSEQQALRELAVATAQLDSLQSKGVVADSAITENAELKQVGRGFVYACGVLQPRDVIWWGALCFLRPVSTCIKTAVCGVECGAACVYGRGVLQARDVV